jgi:hypothetical protein
MNLTYVFLGSSKASFIVIMIIQILNLIRFLILRPFKAKLINLLKIISDFCGILSLIFSFQANQYYLINIDQSKTLISNSNV